MLRWTSMLRVLPVSVVFLTGCTTLKNDFNRIRAGMTKPETDQDVHNYGAFFTSSLEAPFTQRR